jgi:PAS domain S-box-containing protein
MSTPDTAALLLEHTQDKVAVVDEAGTYEYVNPAGERILGFEAAELTGESAFGFVHPSERATVVEAFQDATGGEETYASRSVRYRHATDDGGWVWLESRLTNLSDDVLDGYIISSRDISEQVAAEREREATELKLQELAAAADDVLWMGTGDWSELLFANPAYEELFGQSVGYLRADPSRLLEAIHPADRPAVEEGMARLSEGEPVDMEYRVNPEREYDRWVWAKGEPIVEDGEVVRLVGFVRDVTSRHRRERQLAVMDNFLRHNVRNQLNVVLGEVDLIESTAAAGDTEGIRQQVAVIRRASNRLVETADKQRDISRILQDGCEPTAVDVPAAVENTVTALRAEYPDAELSTDVPRRLRVVAVPEYELCLRELVENSIKHARGTPEVVVAAERDGEAGVVSVRDRNRPLPEFDRAVLAGDHEMDAVYHSSGCGLWLVYWAVDRSDGTVTYEHDDGNVVGVRLPLATD